MSGPGWLWRRLRDRAVGLVRTLRAALRPGAAERELDAEHAFHIEMETEKRIREGADPAEARRQARLAFGGVERWQEEVRAARWTSGLERLWLDVRYAFRTLVGRPLFTGVVVLTLGVAIGAGTAVFSLVDAVVLHPLDVPAADRLVGVEIELGDEGLSSTVSYPDYRDLARGGESVLTGLAAHSLRDIAVSDGARSEAALGTLVSGSYFSVLNVTPALGRFFGPAETSPDDPAAVAVLSHDAWRTRFGGDPGVVGRELHINGQALTVIGVAEEGFNGAFLGAHPVAWMPLGLAGRLESGGPPITSRTARRWLQLVGRLAPGVTAEGAEGVLSTAAAGMAATYDYDDRTRPGDVHLTRYRGLPPSAQAAGTMVLLLLLGAALLLLLVAAVNVAGMQLARATARSRELGVRMALGAGRGRLVRQLGVEGAVLGLGGAAVGVGIGAAAGRIIGQLEPPGAEGFALELGINAPVLAFAVGAGLLASLLFGLLPAVRAVSDVRTAVSDSGGSRRSTRLRSTLVGGQVALTLVLLVSTLLLVRSLRTAAGMDHGFQPEGVVMAELNLRLNDYDEARGRAFYDALLQALDAAPEIATASLTTSVPLDARNYDRTYARVPSFDATDPSGHPVAYAAVSAGFFRTVGMTLRAGSPPTATYVDGPQAVLPVVVNRTMAERFWGEDQAVGQPFTLRGADAVVTGVAPAGRYRSYGEAPMAFAYLPFQRAYSPAAIALFRPAGARGPAVSAFRRELARLDPHVPAIYVTTMDRAMGQSLFLQRFAAALVGVFSAVGLLLAATGIFGLLAYAVALRRREIGIRMAIGAATGTVVRSVVRTGLRPVLIGTALGLAGALAVTGVLENALVGVSPRDPVSFAAAGVFVLLAAAIAAFFPALRAARVDPAAVLRVE